MRYYCKTRHTAWVVLSAVVLTVLLLLLINRPIALRQGGSVPIAFVPAVPLQIVIVGALTLGLTGRTEQFEFSSIRPLWALRLMNATILAAVGAAAAATVAAITVASGVDPGTVGDYAQLRAFLGLFGVALGVIAFTDMRLGALCALPLVMLPAGFDLQRWPLGEALGFVLAPESSLISWVSSGVLFVCGIVLYVCCYSERNSPSADRRALIDSRGRRRRAVAS